MTDKTQHDDVRLAPECKRSGDCHRAINGPGPGCEGSCQLLAEQLSSWARQPYGLPTRRRLPPSRYATLIRPWATQQALDPPLPTELHARLIRECDDWKASAKAMRNRAVAESLAKDAALAENTSLRDMLARVTAERDQFRVGLTRNQDGLVQGRSAIERVSAGRGNLDSRLEALAEAWWGLVRETWLAVATPPPTQDGHLHTQGTTDDPPLFCAYEDCDQDCGWVAPGGDRFCSYHAADGALAELDRGERLSLAAVHGTTTSGVRDVSASVAQRMSALEADLARVTTERDQARAERDTLVRGFAAVLEATESDGEWSHSEESVDGLTVTVVWCRHATGSPSRVTELADTDEVSGGDTAALCDNVNAARALLDSERLELLDQPLSDEPAIPRSAKSDVEVPPPCVACGQACSSQLEGIEDGEEPHLLCSGCDPESLRDLLRDIETQLDAATTRAKKAEAELARVISDQDIVARGLAAVFDSGAIAREDWTPETTKVPWRMCDAFNAARDLLEAQDRREVVALERRLAREQLVGQDDKRDTQLREELAKRIQEWRRGIQDEPTEHEVTWDGRTVWVNSGIDCGMRICADELALLLEGQ